MSKKILLSGLIPFLAWGLLEAAPASRWLHVTVEEAGERSEIVRVNLPLVVVEKALPAIRDEHIRRGRVALGDIQMDKAGLREMWNAVREAGEAEFVTVEGADENVRVTREGEFIVVRAMDRKEGAGKVDVRLPLQVVDALLSGEGEELDILAAIRELERHEGDLVIVHDGDSKVRIWVDGQNTQK